MNSGPMLSVGSLLRANWIGAAGLLSQGQFTNDGWNSQYQACIRDQVDERGVGEREGCCLEHVNRTCQNEEIP